MFAQSPASNSQIENSEGEAATSHPSADTGSNYEKVNECDAAAKSNLLLPDDVSKLHFAESYSSTCMECALKPEAACAGLLDAEYIVTGNEGFRSVRKTALAVSSHSLIDIDSHKFR